MGSNGNGNNDPYITEKLCAAYRNTITVEIKSIKKDISDLEGSINESVEKIDKRMWWVLGSVVVFGIISIIVALYG